MKLCKDCRWFIPRGENTPHCGHPAAAFDHTNPVDGVTKQLRWSAEWFRFNHQPCGPDAKLFEPQDAARGFV